MPRDQHAVTSDAVIFLPGIMGSELVDAQGRIVWGMKLGLLFRQGVFHDVLERLVPKPDDGIRASRPIQFPMMLPLLSSMDPYRALAHRLQQVVVEPAAVLPFPYDWRRSVVDAARELAPVAHAHLAAWRARWRTLSREARRGLSEPRLTLVCHSMGGLVASHFAAYGEGGEEVRQLVTLGTPFGGSLNAIRVLASGEQLPLGLFAPSLQRAVRQMPGLYELLARWRCVSEGEDHRKLTQSDLEGIGADPALAADASATMDAIDRAFGGQAGRRPPVRCVVGTTQPTRQSLRLEAGTAAFEESIDGTDHRGDGTVFRYAGIPKGVDQPGYLPQSHGALAKSPEALEFVAAVLTERSLGEFQAPPGVGLRVPDVVEASKPFTAEVLDAAPGATCSVHDADDGRLLDMVKPQRRDGRLVASITVGVPGLYRVSVAGGGFSPVEHLVAAIAGH